MRKKPYEDEQQDRCGHEERSLRTLLTLPEEKPEKEERVEKGIASV